MQRGNLHQLNTSPESLYDFSQRLQGGMAMDELFASLPQRQSNLNRITHEIISSTPLEISPQLVVNGFKTLERAQEKTTAILDNNPAQLHDLSRVKIRLHSPKDADKIIEGFKNHGIELCTPDWHISNRGNVRRKIYAAIPDDNGRPFVSEIIFEMIMKLPEGVYEENIRTARNDIYRYMRQMDKDGRLIAATDTHYTNVIWPDFEKLSEKLIQSLPPNYILDGIKQPPDTILSPMELTQLLLEQSRKIMHEVTQHQSAEWKDLTTHLQMVAPDPLAPSYTRR